MNYFVVEADKRVLIGIWQGVQAPWRETGGVDVVVGWDGGEYAAGGDVVEDADGSTVEYPAG